MSRSPNRLLAVIFGAFFVVVGLLGFFVTGGVGFFATSGGLLLGLFEVNLFHNVAHLLIGLILLGAGLGGVSSARTVNTVIGGAYLVLGIAGLFLVGTGLNSLAINGADNVLHFASSVVLLAVGLGAERRRTASA
jgi:hypothetical protein